MDFWTVAEEDLRRTPIEVERILRARLQWRTLAGRCWY